MSKLVCVGVSDGNMVLATPGIIPPIPPCSSGAWTAGPIIYTYGSKITVDGNKGVTKAECTFIWAGSPPPPPCKVSDTSNVTLSPPSSTKLTDNGKNLLRLGDIAQDSYLNTLLVVGGSNTKLKSS